MIVEEWEPPGPAGGLPEFDSFGSDLRMKLFLVNKLIPPLPTKCSLIAKRTCGSRLAGIVAALALCGPAAAQAQNLTAALAAYDTAIANDAASGTPTAEMTSSVVLTGSGPGMPFNFGPSGANATMEFILQGYPYSGNSAFLAMGATTASSLRYAQWEATYQLGFTATIMAPTINSLPRWPRRP